MQVKMVLASVWSCTLPAGASVVTKVPTSVSVVTVGQVATFTALAIGGSQIVVTLAGGVTVPFVISVLAS
jgi:hypothetical protein